VTIFSVEKWFADEFEGSASGSHPTSGALEAQAATVAGTAVHYTLHTTTGTLAAQAATLSGSALHPHTTTGSLTAQAATLSGTAAAGLHATSGALSAQAATLSGTALHPHTTTGALSAQAATVSGTALHPHTTTGTLSAQAATVSGSALHPHLSSGALSGQAATLSGTANHVGAHPTSGALSAQAATLSGSAIHPHTSTGDLDAQAAQVSGDAEHIVFSAEKFTSGALTAGEATVFGLAKLVKLRATAGRRNYIIRGKRYWNLTNEELVLLIARDLIDVTREDIKVHYKNQKPHTVGKTAWESLQDTLKTIQKTIPQQYVPDNDDEEAILMLL
jgi:K+-transporting ATPase c subunit